MNPLSSYFQPAGHSARPVIMVAAGSGQVAQSAVNAGADMLFVSASAVYSQLGTSPLGAFLPFGNSNQLTLDLLKRTILRAAGKVPIVAGVMATDPETDLDALLVAYKELGVAGVANWPACGYLDGQFRELYECESGGVSAEVALFNKAHQLGLASFAIVVSPEDTDLFCRAGVDALILNLGLTRELEDVVEKRDQLGRGIQKLNAMLSIARADRKRPLCLVNGGPATSLEDFEQVARYTKVDGFMGSAAFERFPVDRLIGSLVRHFKNSNQSGAATGFGDLVGSTPKMRELFNQIQRVAPYDVSVCIEGETGVGKELVAGLIHRLSPRASKSFVTLNCGALPDTLLESELFGHEKGAFTGALRRRLGKFELANTGTLFLDEVGDLSPHGQVALLRVLQQKEFTRIGGEDSVSVDVRVIAATNRQLSKMVGEGRFRADLFHRLNQTTLIIPPLRERRDDIPLLVEKIFSRLRVQLNRPLVGVTPGFMKKLTAHPWPGNVRELEHALCQSALMETTPVLTGEYFSRHQEQQREGNNLNHQEEIFLLSKSAKKSRLKEILIQSKGNKSRAAAALGITRYTLYSWLKEAQDKENGEEGFSR